MLQEAITTPIIYFALDNIATYNVDTYGALSVENSTPTELEALEKAQKTVLEQTADVYDYLKRVPIPITDKLLPIHYTGGSHQQSHIVDYLDDQALLTRGSNKTILNFELKNSVSQLSTIADLLLGIADKGFFTSNEPRVSFFSPNLCIFNAYLRGINRTIVSNTDKEILSITLENAPNRLDSPTTPEKPTAFKNAVTDAGAISQNVDVGLLNNGVFKQISADEIDYSFTWYQVFSIDELEQIEVPDYQPDFTIDRENIRIMRVNSVDLSGSLRYMITTEYKNVFTTLKAANGQAYNDKYGMMIYNDNLYFGVLNEN